MTDEELLSLAEASNVEVPCELSGKLDSLVKRLDAQEQRKFKVERFGRARIYAYAGFGLVAASIAIVLFLGTPSTQPKDTFSSPEEAYAMLESTFAHIASKTGAATVTLGSCVQCVEDTITDIYK